MKLVSNWEHVKNQKIANFLLKKDVYVNFEGFQMQKGITPTDRTQRIDDKNGVVCLVINFFP